MVSIPDQSCHQFAGQPQNPVTPRPTESRCPYPYPEAEMIARYGLRRLTPEEQNIFPGLRLVLDVFKARLIKPPSIMPGAQSGWVVWVAETYPGHYLIRMPGGTSLLAPYHRMEWNVVDRSIPAMTLASAKIEEKRRRWQAVVRRSIQQTLALE